MQKRYLPIAIITGALFLIAIGGYLIPADSDGPSARILLENKGGKVILNHADHVTSVLKDCGKCHHTSGNSLDQPQCSACHVKKFDEAFIADHQDSLDKDTCISCHHAKADTDNFSHDDHAEDYSEGDCLTCHHDPSIEATPQACSNCHMDGSNSVPRLRDATHARCADCHDDMYDEGINGCANCHTRHVDASKKPETKACKDCHENPVDQLIPTGMNAFHTQCMGCHESANKGPFGDDACYQCHMK